MGPIEREGYLEREFGIWRVDRRDCFAGIMVANDSFINLVDALNHLIRLTTRREFSKICIQVSDEVTLIVNTPTPMGIEMDDWHEDEIPELADTLIKTPDWRITDVFEDYYVFSSIETDWPLPDGNWN